MDSKFEPLYTYKKLCIVDSVFEGESRSNMKRHIKQCTVKLSCCVSTTY